MKPLRIKQVGEHLTNSYKQWREYLSNNKQYTILKKELPRSIDKTKNVLSKLNTEFLGNIITILMLSILKLKHKKHTTELNDL